jgi:hypothetical protein
MQVQVLQFNPTNLVGKGKYKCKYYNKAPIFKLVEVGMDPGITMKPQNSSW